VRHGKTASRISARALDMLTRYSWPGHVRELANVIERAVLLCDDEVVHGHHLSPAIHAADGGGAPAPFSLVRIARRLREGSAARRPARGARRAQPGRAAAADHGPHLQLQGAQARDRLPPLQG
jgi:DNA-binding NtrC family response regulator